MSRRSVSHRSTRALLLGLGLALVGLSWWARIEAQSYARTLALMGGISLLLGLVLSEVLEVIDQVLPRLRRGKAGPFEIELEEERRAAADLATDEVAPEDVERLIGSADEVAPSPSPQDAEVVGSLNYMAGTIALQGIFEWSTEDGQPLAGCEIRLYLYDSKAKLLAPVLADEEAVKATHWPVGKGATGTAYATGDYVLAPGAAASDGTYGLTRAQQKKYRDLSCVAAAPVFNDASKVIGVVTAMTTAPDQRLSTPEGRRDHTLAALLVSRVMVELLQWFDDE